MAPYQLSNLALLLCHALVSVALLGAVSHQSVAVLRHNRAPGGEGFVARYANVRSSAFAWAVPLLYTLNFALGAVLYPEYRVESRYALEEMRALPVIGLFEIKEHWAAIGLGLLPLYLQTWRADSRYGSPVAVTLTLFCIVWFTFLTGHVVNNFRGV